MIAEGIVRLTLLLKSCLNLGVLTLSSVLFLGQVSIFIFTQSESCSFDRVFDV